MCNRVRGPRDLSGIPRSLAPKLINFEANPNVAPTESTPTFLSGLGQEPTFALARFGISSETGKSLGRGLILNTRMETARTGYYDWMLHSRRCIIPVEGFYEFKKVGSVSQPYFFHRTDERLMLLAGLWDYSEVDGSQVPSFSIMTSPPNSLISEYHDRMPVVVDDPLPWLTASSNPLDAIAELDIGLFSVRPVNPAVNSPREKDLSKIEAPIAGAAQGSLF